MAGCVWMVVQEDSVVPTLGWTLDLLVGRDQARDAAVFIPKERPRNLLGSLQASGKEDDSIGIVFLVIRMFEELECCQSMLG